MRPSNPSQALRNAIAAEAAAARFYEVLASRSEDEQVRAFFEAMIRVEKEHGQEIERVGRNLVKSALPAFATQSVAEIETVPEWKSAEGLGFDEAIHVAVMCEHQAAMHYADLAELFDGELRDFFRSVASSEQQHANMLEEVLRKRIETGCSTFTFRQVVRNMIEVERASGRFYSSLAKRCPNAQARSFLQGMIEVEQLHAGQIESLGRSIDDGELPEVPNLDIKHLETPPSWPAPVNINLEAALGLALEAERRAGRYYRVLAGAFSGKQAEFLYQMAETEDDHAASIEDLLTRLRD